MGVVLRRVDSFWAYHPAMFIGTTFFLGGLWGLNRQFFSRADLALIPFFAFLFPYRRFFWAVFLVCVAGCSTSLRVKTPDHQMVRNGEMVAEVVDRCLVTIHGQKLWKMRLLIHAFRAHDGSMVVRNVTVPLFVASPCKLFGGNLYLLKAILRVDDRMQVRLRPYLAKDIPNLGTTCSFVEWRLRVKAQLNKLFVTLFPDHEIRQVAGALTFGLSKEGALQRTMHRAGIEHVLAVSGFHFGIVAALMVFLCQWATPKLQALLAMSCLTAYFLIIGPLPSVIRAWCAAMVVFGGVLLNRRASGINCLGVGLIVITLYDPSMLTGIGFQLSFLATAAILLFSRPTLGWLRRLFPERRVIEIVHCSRADQLVLLILRIFIPIVSLLIPVTLVVCPYQMAFLQDFSVLGILYNLLIPTIFSLAMPAVLLAVFLSPIPLVSQVCAAVAAIPLRLGLLFIENATDAPWVLLEGKIIPQTVACGLLMTLFAAGILVHDQESSPIADEWKACL